MLTFRWDGDGSGWGLILVYELEVEGVRHRLTTTALPMPVFPDDWMKGAPVAAEVGENAWDEHCKYDERCDDKIGKYCG